MSVLSPNVRLEPESGLRIGLGESAGMSRMYGPTVRRNMD